MYGNINYLTEGPNGGSLFRMVEAVLLFVLGCWNFVFKNKIQNSILDKFCDSNKWVFPDFLEWLKGGGTGTAGSASWSKWIIIN